MPPLKRRHEGKQAYFLSEASTTVEHIQSVDILSAFAHIIKSNSSKIGNDSSPTPRIMLKSHLSYVVGVDWKSEFTRSVDRLLDASPIFSSSVRQAFQEYQQPQPQPPPLIILTATTNTPDQLAPKPESSVTESTSNHPSAVDTKIPKLPTYAVQPALNLVLKKVSSGVDPLTRKLSLREFKYEDIIALVSTTPSILYEPLTFEAFEMATRQAFRNLALEKFQRLAKYLLGGFIMARLLHRIFRGIPFIGKYIGKVLRIIMPTPIVGPLLGIGGAIVF